MDPLTHLFTLLSTYRHLPAYQLERRADIFFALYLRDIVQERTGVELEHDMIPELPLRVDRVLPGRESHQSVKVDYALFARDRSRVFFVELKTDAGSRRQTQDEYLEAARGVGFRHIVDGIRDILLRTSAHQKYYHLTWRLAQLGFLELPADLESFLYPKPRRGHLKARLRDIHVTQLDPPIEVLYVQPESSEGDRCIDFEDVASHVGNRSDPLSQAFARHLLAWRAPAGSKPPGR